MAENATLSFYEICTSLNTASQTIYSPITGVIKRITIAWPSGCNFLVEVLFRLKRTQFVPTPATGAAVGIRLNNYTEQINPNYYVEINDPIEMYLINHDSVNNHAISAVMHIETIEESEGAGTPLHPPLTSPGGYPRHSEALD
jgi:hypothetical protein